jgi:hypothetical protein
MNDRIIGQGLTIRLCDGSTVEGICLTVEGGQRVFRSSNGDKLKDVERVVDGTLSVTPGLYAMICANCPLEEP